MDRKRSYAWFESVDPEDLPAMELWAERVARGTTLESLASDLEVEPSIKAVVASLTAGHSAETKAVVASGLETAFRRTADGSATTD